MYKYFNVTVNILALYFMFPQKNKCSLKEIINLTSDSVTNELKSHLMFRIVGFGKVESMKFEKGFLVSLRSMIECLDV